MSYTPNIIGVHAVDELLFWSWVFSTTHSLAIYKNFKKYIYCISESMYIVKRKNWVQETAGAHAGRWSHETYVSSFFLISNHSSDSISIPQSIPLELLHLICQKYFLSHFPIIYRLSRIDIVPVSIAMKLIMLDNLLSGW